MAVSEGVEVYRPGSARPIAVATWLTCSAMAAGQVLAGPLDAPGPYAVLSGLALVAAAAWATMWRPRVEAAPHGVVLLNPLRTVLVTWPALVEIDGRYGLRLETAHGRWSAWAAAPPAGRERRAGGESEVGVLVRRAWEDVERAGHLRRGALEEDGADVTWHARSLALLGALALATVLLAILS